MTQIYWFTTGLDGPLYLEPWRPGLWETWRCRIWSNWSRWWPQLDIQPPRPNRDEWLMMFRKTMENHNQWIPMDHAPRKCYQIYSNISFSSFIIITTSSLGLRICWGYHSGGAVGENITLNLMGCWWVEVWTLEKWWKCESIGKILPARTENPTWFERPQPISWKHVQMHFLKQQKTRSAWRDLGARTMSSNLAAWKLMETIGFDHPWMVSWWLWGCHGTTNNLNKMAWSMCVHLMPMLMGKLMISHDIYWYFGTPCLWRSPG